MNALEKGFDCLAAPSIHLFDTPLGKHLLLLDGSRIYAIDAQFEQSLKAGLKANDEHLIAALLEQQGLLSTSFIEHQAPESFPTRAISLSVAQKCNLGCSYCYAQGGQFGGPAVNMSQSVAQQAIDHLLAETPSGGKANIAFMGGEPLVNRQLIYWGTEYAHRLAQRKGIYLSFSLTTNGTLVTPEDGDFFEQYAYALTVSLDGIGEVHDHLRPFLGGQGSFERIVKRIQPLLDLQQRMQVSARVTVTPANLKLAETLDGLIDMGFYGVGFSPMLSAPNPCEQMQTEHLQQFLEQMKACGNVFLAQALQGKSYPFTNIQTAVAEIHHGTHRPYPCGAGAAYVGVSSNGDLFACHRFVDDDKGRLGSVDKGIEPQAQKKWLAEHHVHQQTPCQSCWARYLCGGGCYYEVNHRGRPACDYIRAWLDYCLSTYVQLLENGYFKS